MKRHSSDPSIKYVLLNFIHCNSKKFKHTWLHHPNRLSSILELDRTDYNCTVKNMVSIHISTQSALNWTIKLVGILFSYYKYCIIIVYWVISYTRHTLIIIIVYWMISYTRHTLIIIIVHWIISYTRHTLIYATSYHFENALNAQHNIFNVKILKKNFFSRYCSFCQID